MEKILSKLFDYQKYESNPRLDKLIKGVEERYPQEIQVLSDDELGNLMQRATPICCLLRRKISNFRRTTLG